MHFWFVHSGEVSLREQICTQVNLGIFSGELRAGQRLPSTREMARRYFLHPNTVSTAYQQLQDEGILERRNGSGVYVREFAHVPTIARDQTLDRLIANFVTSARLQGFSTEEVMGRARRWMEVQPPDHFLLVEPDETRQEIVFAELRPHLRFPLRAATFEEAAKADGCIAIALPSKAMMARQVLPPHIELITLQLTNVPADMHKWLPVPEDALVGIVSRWPGFVRMAKTMLVATAFNPDAMVERIRGTPGWSDGLTATAAVLCDVPTAKFLPARVRAVVFQFVSDAALAELRKVEATIAARLGASSNAENAAVKTA